MIAYGYLQMFQPRYMKTNKKIAGKTYKKDLRHFMSELRAG